MAGSELVTGAGHQPPSPPLPPTAPASRAAVASALRSLPDLATASDAALFALARGGKVELRELARDQLCEIDDAICFVTRGQVALAAFDRATLVDRREHRQRDAVAGEEDGTLMPPAPLAHVATRNLALFVAGDHYNARAIAGTEVLGDAVLCSYSLAPSQLLAIEPDALAALVGEFPALERALSGAQLRAGRRLRAVGGVKQAVLDFYLRNGLSVAGPMVRVRQLDLCIDCKQCEEACEERHGARRLTLGGFELGVLDFVFSCRSCTDARCLPPCEHDAIARQPSGEVVIDPQKCIGCSLCALSCPYGAIDMINVAEPELPSFNQAFRDRHVKSGALDPAKPKRAAIRRLANKCDHCGGYADQACVSACPTGSLIELDPVALFRERPAAGERERRGRVKELLPLEPFTGGIGVKDGGLARVRQQRFGTVLWAIGLLAWLACVVEVGLRKYAPALSLSFRGLLADGLSRDVAEMNVSYLAGSSLAVMFGYIGTALMLLSMAYPLRRRFGVFKVSATNKFWLDVHLMTGTVGPLFILLHSALRLDTWVSVAFWSMAMVVGSGVLGRYLYTMVPALSHGHNLEILDHTRWLSEFRRSHPEAAAVADRTLAAEAARSEYAATGLGLASLLPWMLWDELARPFRLRRCRTEMRRSASGKQVRLAMRHVWRLFFLERRKVIAPRGQLLLKGWKRIHIPFSVALLVTTILHVVLSFNLAT